MCYEYACRLYSIHKRNELYSTSSDISLWTANLLHVSSESMTLTDSMSLLNTDDAAAHILWCGRMLWRCTPCAGQKHHSYLYKSLGHIMTDIMTLLLCMQYEVVHNSVFFFFICIHTQWTIKKRDILFLTITLAYLDRFLQFLYHFNPEEILHATVVKFTTSP